MKKPELPGYEIQELIGESFSSSLWLAEDPLGNEVVVRALKEGTVDLDHLQKMVERLDGVEAQDHGPVPIWIEALDIEPGLLVHPFYGRHINGEIVPMNLQTLLAEYLATDKASEMVRCLAIALAECHRHQVIHGNIRPGNVFVSDAGQVLLAGYGLGWMAEVKSWQFGDELLYMAPEQLLEPEREEGGFAWDVYAFGVLAYRLLEGRFPRSDTEFSELAPPSGTRRKLPLAMDSGELVEGVMQQPIAEWRRNHDEVLKEVIERCLEIEPDDRFRDMVDLCAFWRQRLMERSHEREIEDLGKKAGGNVSWKWAAIAASAACLLFLLSLGYDWLSGERSKSEQLALKLTEVQKEKEQQLQEVREVAEQARNEVEEGNLERARLTQEKQTMQGGLDSLAQGREALLTLALKSPGDLLEAEQSGSQELELLNQQYEKLLSNETRPNWQKRWKKEWASLAIATGNSGKAREVLADDLSLLDTQSLVMLLLQESTLKNVAQTEVDLARTTVAKASREEQAIFLLGLELVEARNLERGGQTEEALESFVKVLQKAQDIEQASHKGLSLWRTRLQREAAGIAESLGERELATVLREKVVEELAQKIKKERLSGKKGMAIREEYVLAASGLSEAIYAQGRLATAEKIASESISLIANTSKPRVKVALAVHHAVLGGCLRERGRAKEARSLLETGLVLVNKEFELPSDERWRQYRKALLEWQMGGVLGQLGEREKEMELSLQAVTELEALLASSSSEPSSFQLHRVMGYLCADLGAAYASAGHKKLSQETFTKAVKSWKFLLDSDPDEREYLAGLRWCETRRSH